MADETGSVDWSNVRARAAFDEVAPEAAALAPERVQRVNLDVAKATGTVRVKLPGLLELRSEIARHMPLFDLGRLERLGTYALALFYANGGHLAASAPARPLEGLDPRGIYLRRLVLLDPDTQAFRGSFDPAVLAAIREGNGYLDLGEDLITLVHLYRSGKVDVHTQSALQEQELEEAEVLAPQILEASAARTAEKSTTGTSGDVRDRVFTLFIEAYNDARRAVRYLKSDEEANRLAPSLYGDGRARKREDAEAPDGPSAPPAAGVTHAPVPAPAAAPARAAAPALSGYGSGALDAPIDPALTKVGMPESPPFTE